MLNKRYGTKFLTFDILEDEGKFVGINTVRIDGTPVLRDEFPLKAVLTAAGGIVYDESRLLDVKLGKDGEIQLKTEICGGVPSFPINFDIYEHPVPPSQQRVAVKVCDSLIWRIRPEMRAIGSYEYRGFSLSFVFASNERKLHDIYLYSNWQLGGSIENLYLVCQQWGASASPWEWKANREAMYSTSEYFGDNQKCFKALDMMVRGGGTCLLDFQFKPGMGLLARWFEKPVMITSKVEKEAGSEVVCFYDRICCAGKTNHETEKMMLMTSQKPALTLIDGRNAWLQAFREINKETAAAYGINPEEPEPMLFIDTVGGWPQHRPGKQSPDFYDKWTRRLSDIVRMGFKRILLHTPGWISDATETGLGNVCCIWDHIVADEFGGNAALEKFSKAAHDENLQVIVWIGSHLSIWCRNLQEHPDWAVRYPDGTPKLIPDVGLNRPGNMNSGLKDKLLEQLRAVRKCGVDGIWYDSFHNIAIYHVVEHVDGTRSLQAPAVLDFLRQLQEMGFILQLETVGAYGCSSCGIAWDKNSVCQQHVSDLRGIEYTASKTGLALRGEQEFHKFDRKTIFRLMAHQAVLGLNCQDIAGFEWIWPIAVPEDIVELQHLYLRLASYRGPIELIEGGAFWHPRNKPETRVLWALEDVTFSEGLFETVQDITGIEPVAVPPGTFHAEAGRVYLLILSVKFQPRREMTNDNIKNELLKKQK